MARLRLIRVTKLPTWCYFTIIPGQIYAGHSSIMDIQFDAVYYASDNTCGGRESITHLIHNQHRYVLIMSNNAIGLACDGHIIASVSVPIRVSISFTLVFHNSTENPLRIYVLFATMELFEFEIDPE